MPKQKDLKRLARSRTQKTGESYTTSRSQLLKKKASPAKTVNRHRDTVPQRARASTARTGLPGDSKNPNGTIVRRSNTGRGRKHA